MANQDDFEFFMDQLLDAAIREFKETERYKLLQEKLEQMDRDCDDMFAASEREFATKCFELLLDVAGQEEQYVYRKGLLDGVKILRRLGAFA